VPKVRELDGVDLVPYLKGKRDGRPHEVLFWRMNQRTAVRVDDWKLVRNPGRGSGADWQLYNLAEDVSESNDLAQSHPEKLNEIKAGWAEMNGQMIQPVPGPRR
jgi:arylsulfatase B